MSPRFDITKRLPQYLPCQKALVPVKIHFLLYRNITFGNEI